jgi:LAGLIDADG endonuclease
VIYYTVGSTKDLVKYILPHFDKYPLATIKRKDYLIFKDILLLMDKGEHNNLNGLLKIFSLRRARRAAFFIYTYKKIF